MRPMFIDSDVRILTGTAAEKALREKNDLPFFTRDSGVVAVSAERWQEAQHAEKLHWMKYGIRCLADRNEHHAGLFQGYSALRGMRFHDAIELGCGPFTNLRLVARSCGISRCTLLDPLIREYVAHPNCAYADNQLIVERRLYGENLLGAVLSRIYNGAYNVVRRAVNPSVPVHRLINSSIEDMPVDSSYDLMCVVNVVEHCFDINRVFKNMLSVLPKGGVLIFHDRYYDAGKLEGLLESLYDAAHPLRVDRKVIEQFLHDNFDALEECVVSESLGGETEGDMPQVQSVYYIGRRR